MTAFLTLGEVVFANNEIPETINFGGAQSLSVKQLVGGKRIIDVMGRVDDDISWSGLFYGTTATFRAKFLDSLRVQGSPLNLSWSQFNYSVVIRSFKCDFQRSYQIPYSITVTVIQDLNKPFPILVPVSYSDALQNQLVTANDLATTIADPNITNAMALVSFSLNNIPDINNATNNEIASVIEPIIIAQNVISSAIQTLSMSTFL